VNRVYDSNSVKIGGGGNTQNRLRNSKHTPICYIRTLRSPILSGLPTPTLRNARYDSCRKMCLQLRFRWTREELNECEEDEPEVCPADGDPNCRLAGCIEYVALHARRRRDEGETQRLIFKSQGFCSVACIRMHSKSKPMLCGTIK